MLLKTFPKDNFNALLLSDMLDALTHYKYNVTVYISKISVVMNESC